MPSDRSTPPIPNYEDLSVQALRDRVRSLSAEQVRELIAYEESRSGRMEVLELLKDRLSRLEGEFDSSDGGRAE